MKIAAGIIGVFLGLIVILQSCVVATTAHIGARPDIGEAASVGIVVALLIAVGGAFSFALPLVASLVFGAASLIAFAISGKFEDMGFWGAIALALAVMTFFAWRSGRAKLKVAAAPPALGPK